jgi:hypothetical protein
MSGVAHSSYNRRRIFCNGFVARALDRLLGEALPREVASCSGAPAPLRDDLQGTRALRLELLDRFVDQLESDAAAVEVVADEEIACAAPRKQLGAPVRQPRVVDGADTHESLDGFLLGPSRHVPAGKPFRELSFGQIASRDRPGSPRQSLVLPQLVPQPSRSLPVQLDADIEPGREHDLRRQGSPGLTLERNLDSPARPRAQRANPWRRPSP